MKKKGFTLVELLGVASLLGIIALLSIPVIQKSIKSSKQKLYDEQISYIKEGLKNWAHTNIFLLPEVNESITLTIGQLQQSGDLNLKIINPKNKKCFSNASLLTISKKNNSYIYEVKDLKDMNCSLTEEVPTIKLSGSEVEYVKVGDAYIDSFVARSSNGSDITSKVTKTITGSGSSIITTQEGYYTVTYKVEDNGKETTVIRNVFVKNEVN